MFTVLTLLAQNGAPCSNTGTADGLNLADCIELAPGTSVGQIYSTPTDVLNVFLNVAFIFAGLIIFAMFLYSGFLFISDTSKGKDQAKDILSNSLTGLVIMFCAFWVVKIIEILIGQQILF